MDVCLLQSSIKTRPKGKQWDLPFAAGNAIYGALRELHQHQEHYSMPSAIGSLVTCDGDDDDKDEEDGVRVESEEGID